MLPQRSGTYHPPNKAGSQCRSRYSVTTNLLPAEAALRTRPSEGASSEPAGYGAREFGPIQVRSALRSRHSSGPYRLQPETVEIGHACRPPRLGTYSPQPPYESGKPWHARVSIKPSGGSSK